MVNILVGCESSGVVREACRALGYNAWSCDVLPADDGSPYHIQCDVRRILRPSSDNTYYRGPAWDLGIFHPPCTRLANSGVRWLDTPPPGKTVAEMWAALDAGAAFYRELRDAPIPFKALENPIMHKHARARLGHVARHVVQPWWFGEPFFKATGFEVINLPPLQATRRLAPPAPGTAEHKAWSMVHRAPPGPDRWKIRSRTFAGIAAAMADQWGGYVAARLALERAG